MVPKQYLLFYIALPYEKVIPEERDYRESDNEK